MNWCGVVTLLKIGFGFAGIRVYNRAVVTLPP